MCLHFPIFSVNSKNFPIFWFLFYSASKHRKMSFIFRTSPGPPGLIPLEIFSGVEAKLELGAQKFFFSAKITNILPMLGSWSSSNSTTFLVGVWEMISNKFLLNFRLSSISRISLLCVSIFTNHWNRCSDDAVHVCAASQIDGIFSWRGRDSEGQKSYKTSPFRIHQQLAAMQKKNKNKEFQFKIFLFVPSKA